MAAAFPRRGAARPVPRRRNRGSCRVPKSEIGPDCPLLTPTSADHRCCVRGCSYAADASRSAGAAPYATARRSKRRSAAWSPRRPVVLRPAARVRRCRTWSPSTRPTSASAPRSRLVAWWRPCTRTPPPSRSTAALGRTSPSLHEARTSRSSSTKRSEEPAAASAIHTRSGSGWRRRGLRFSRSPFTFKEAAHVSRRRNAWRLRPIASMRSLIRSRMRDGSRPAAHRIPFAIGPWCICRTARKTFTSAGGKRASFRVEPSTDTAQSMHARRFVTFATSCGRFSTRKPPRDTGPTCSVWPSAAPRPAVSAPSSTTTTFSTTCAG